MGKLTSIKTTNSSKEAVEFCEEVLAWAKEGKITTIGICVVFSDRKSYSDWCGDQPSNIDTLVGGLSRLGARIIKDTEEDDD